ncbi:Outer-membrane lipoprotein carrier protein precursor [compost metagenome]
MKTFHRLAVVAALSLAPALSFAASAQEQLKSFVATVTSATGSFSQYTVNNQGRTQPAQTGVFSFQRPGKFKWAVQKPYEQLVVSDGRVLFQFDPDLAQVTGRVLFQFDPDLAQVTERKVDAAIGTSPAAILFGSGSLEQSFDVSALPSKDGVDWLRAKPRTADAGFSRVDIGMKDNLPVRVELLDSFGQTTRVDLSAINANPTLPAKEFQFTAPKGVDVVKM